MRLKKGNLCKIEAFVKYSDVIIKKEFYYMIRSFIR